ncbi:hypothetical protein CLOSTHATH_04471, partial [Hungatella hathewayi DSM 13479]
KFVHYNGQIQTLSVPTLEPKGFEFSDTLDGRGGDSAKAAETFLPLITYKPTKSKMDVDLRKFPLITYKTTQVGIGGNL